MPKSTHFDIKRPEKSISALLNHVLKRYLDMDTDVTEYVKPAAEYLKVCHGFLEKLIAASEDPRHSTVRILGQNHLVKIIRKARYRYRLSSQDKSR